MKVPKEVTRQIIAYLQSIPAALALRLVARTFAEAYDPKYLSKHLGASIGVRKNAALMRHNTIIHWSALREQHGTAESMRLILRAGNTPYTDGRIRVHFGADHPRGMEATIRILIHHNSLLLLTNPTLVLEPSMECLIRILMRVGMPAIKHDDWVYRCMNRMFMRPGMSAMLC